MASPPANGPSSAGDKNGLQMPLKQKMAVSLKSLLGSAKKLAIGGDDGDGQAHATLGQLFTKVDPAVDGDDCLHDCDSCHVQYPRGFKIDESDLLYGYVKGWSTHVLVATSKTDWVRDVEDEKGSVMEAFGKAQKPSNGRLMLSASNMPTPNHTPDYSQPTTVLLLPAFAVLEKVTPAAVPSIVSSLIERAPTNTSPLAPVSMPRTIRPALPGVDEVTARASPHAALVLMCSQRTRDARCGQSAPLLRRELERHLRALGLHRDPDDGRPGGVGVYLISHVGGHKYSANVMVYRRPDAFGLDGVDRAGAGAGDEARFARPRARMLDGEAAAAAAAAAQEGGDSDKDEEAVVGAAQCIWLARVRPEDCENIVKYTVLQGKVIKPETQLRGGFDRSKGLLSW